MSPHHRRTPYRDLLQIIVGEGGQSLETYWNLRSVKIAEWVMKGVQRRNRIYMESVRSMCGALASAWGCKNLPEYFPYAEPFPWEEPTRDTSEEGLELERQNAEAVLDEMIKRNQKQ